MEEIENLDESYDIPDTISIFPPSDGYETDEDSGDEAKVDINNLPGNQLRAEAEVSFENNDILSADGYDREDELPLSSFLQPKHQKLLFETSTFKKSKPTFTWKKTDINACLSTWQEKQGSKNTLSPIDLFFLFVDDEIIDLIRNFTNLYASQHNRSGDVSTEEIKCFIGILLLSGYYKFPRRAMYWENAEDAGSKLVYEAMSRDRFSFIMQNLHCNDNTKLTKDDKFTKLRPLFDTLNKKFQAFAPFQEFHSLDESMVPYYGGHGTKQFIRGKPIRWGYKFWTGTTRNGYVEWFEPYQGSGTQLPKKYHHLGLGASVVLQFADVLQLIYNNVPYHIFCDNFFTSIILLIELAKRGIKCTGTMRENRLQNCPLKSSKALKKESRGTFDYSCIEGENIIVCKWNDNNVVTIGSNVTSPFPTLSVKRFSQKEKKHIYINQPHLIKKYNENMGGVDRADQNIGLYRVCIRGKKWYSSLFSHCIDMAEQNAWQLHKFNGGKMDHLTFRRCIASGLLETFKKTTKRGPSKQSKYHRMESRYDRLDHLIVYQEKQTRCGYCHKLAAFRCSKCNVALHPKECFIKYHSRE